MTDARQGLKGFFSKDSEGTGSGWDPESEKAALDAIMDLAMMLPRCRVVFVSAVLDTGEGRSFWRYREDGSEAELLGLVEGVRLRLNQRIKAVDMGGEEEP